MQLKHLLLVGILVLASKVEARAVIDITQGNIEPIPIAIEDFSGDSEIGANIASVIAHDLESTGFFRLIDKNAFLDELKVDKAPNHASWRKINATAIIAGAVHSEGGKIAVDFKMWDPFTEQQTEGGDRYKVNPAGWRRVAHKIADRIYKRITGEEGFFDTRILFIAESGPATRRIKRLAVMDQDGANLKLLTDGRDLVITPRFDMKSQRVIYMSYKNVVPKVFLYNLETGSQKLVGNFPGMSFAPRFSPDGQNAIMSIAKDGSTNIYEIGLQSGALHQLTNDRSVINTSPSYSPDGTQITFNSDRGGSVQLYVMNRDGSGIKRISFGGGTYTTPVWSPRGDFIAFTKMKGGQFFIGVMRPDGSGERLLTTSWLDEGPTWSPNGRVIMFGRGSRSVSNRLYAVDITGYHERQIPTPGDASDPAWSPLLD
jgi:TolB protein